MRKIERRTFIKQAAAAVGGGVFGAPFAHAQEAGWPTKPIHFIVPLAPGGAIDFIARAFGEVMQRNAGQQIVVENRTGAGGTIGMDAAMKSPPDGYTVLITNDNAASAPHIMNLSYDYTKQLLPVCYLARQSQFLAVHSSLGVSTVKELVEYVKKNRGWATPRRASARTSMSPASGSPRRRASRSSTCRIAAPDRRSTI